MRFARVLLVGAVLVSVSITTVAVAGALDTGICCVCQCAGVGTGCTTALGPNFCDQFFASGCGLSDSPCQGDVVGSPCAAIPECAATAQAAPAPAAGAPTLALGALLLAAIAAWRLHRSRSGF